MKDTDRYFIFLVFQAEAIFDLWEMEELECLSFVCLFLCFYPDFYFTQMHLHTWPGFNVRRSRGETFHCWVSTAATEALVVAASCWSCVQADYPRVIVHLHTANQQIMAFFQGITAGFANSLLLKGVLVADLLWSTFHSIMIRAFDLKYTLISHNTMVLMLWMTGVMPKKCKFHGL